MSGSSIEFFGDQEDLSVLFEKFDQEISCKYTQMSSYVNQPPKEYKSAICLLKYLVTFTSPVQVHAFLISEPPEKLVVREVKMKDGSGSKLRIDQNYNKNTIEILLGGHADETTLVTTIIRTTAETKKSKDIFSVYKKIILKNSKKIKNFYLLKNACEKFNGGWRLTQNINYSRVIDLKN